MKNLFAIFAVTAAVSGGIVFAAASGVFGDATSASNKAKIVRPADDPRSMDEIRKEALQKLKEQKHGITPEAKQGPDIAPPTVVTSPEEEAAGSFGLSTPRGTPQQAPQANPTPTPDGTPAEPTSQPPSGLTKDKVKEIINKRTNQ